MFALTKKQQAQLDVILLEVSGKEEEIKEAKEKLERLIESGAPGGTKDFDFYVYKLQRGLRKLKAKLFTFEARHTVSENLVKAAAGTAEELNKTARSQSHLWKPDRKDSHGY